MTYAIWNNKGGVGKTFLSFALASEYAREHPNKEVVLIDMCPQANLSEILLGGNSEGADQLAQLIGEKKTIGAYFDSRIENPHSKTDKERDFLTPVKKHNSHCQPNLQLIAGDPSLEIQGQVMSQISSLDLPDDSWKNVHLWVKNLVSACKEKFGDNCQVFIDCNPSFSVYTEVSIAAADKLIVPCTGDGSSARAIDNLFSLIYGRETRYKKIGFHLKMKEFNLALPKIHSVLLNRSTQYGQQASNAFSAMWDSIKRRIEERKKKDPELFDSVFRHYDMPDAHSAVVVSSYHGIPIKNLTQKKYYIHDKETQLNSYSLNKYQDSISEVVSSL